MTSNYSIAAVVVLYFPDENLMNYIQSYLSYTEILYVIDNTDDVNFKNTYLSVLISLGDKIIYIDNKKNEGIGYALNLAASSAIKNSYQWILTMDQDSFFTADNIEEYISFFKTIATSKNLAVIAPSHKQPSKISEKIYVEVDAVITSGSIINLNAWQKVNGYNKSLFIDEVDSDFCYRIKLNNYKIFLLNNIYLQHHLGTKLNRGYLGIIAKRNRTIHSPSRVYYMVRNYLYVKHKYKKYFPLEFKQRDASMLATLKNNLLFSGKFIQNLKSIIKGCIDFEKIKRF